MWKMQIQLNGGERYVCKAPLHGLASAVHVCVSSGMLLSVFVVTLLTVFYELFKVWRVWLETKSQLAPPALESTLPPAVRSDSSTVSEGSQSELSLTPEGRPLPAVNVRNRSAPL